VVNPYEVAFRAAKSAVGAAEVLLQAKEYSSIAEAIADCTVVVGTTAIGHRQPQQPVHELSAGARLIRRRLSVSGDVAMLFGSEKWGLSNESLGHCHWLMHIPTRSDHRSMNLSQAVAVCLYELVRSSPIKAAAPISKKEAPFATSETVERLTRTLLEALQISGYTNPLSTALAEEKLRRLVRRLKLESADAEVLLGMVHRILWKLRQ
jgi:tRNA/rRNA methyltransferase